jgi:addiction module RelE/StbE family toxin
VNISYTSGFIKQSRHLAFGIRQQLKQSIELFSENPFHPALRNHPLKGKYKSHRSIDVSSDVRALYIQKGNEVIFVAVGTHNQLYG